MTIRFGPAGIGPVKEAIGVLENYHKLGLSACEISFTFQIYIHGEKDAKMMGNKAKELGIQLSIHAPYFVNLNSEEKEKREATKKRILDCCRVGEILGAKTVVFHPGYYSNKGKTAADKEQTYEVIKKGILEIMEEIRKNGWKINIAPETMGKINVFGSVEEISRLAKETGCAFCIDFAHVLAREKRLILRKLRSYFRRKIGTAISQGLFMETKEKEATEQLRKKNGKTY